MRSVWDMAKREGAKLPHHARPKPKRGPAIPRTKLSRIETQLIECIRMKGMPEGNARRDLRDSVRGGRKLRARIKSGGPDAAHFISACELLLRERFSAHKFDVFRDNIQKRLVLNVRDGAQAVTVKNREWVQKSSERLRPWQDRGAYSNYFNVMRRYFYRALTSVLREAHGRTGKTETVYGASPHVQLIQEAMQRMQTLDIGRKP